MCKFSISTFTLALSAFFLVACGDSGSESDNSSALLQRVMMPTGVWQGTSLYQMDGSIYTVVGLIAPNGEARLIADSGEQVKGKLNLYGQTFSGNMVSYSYSGSLLYRGSFSGSYTQDTINAETIINGNVTSKVSLNLDPSTHLGASLERVAGTFVTADQQTSIGIDKGGAISGSDTRGCIYIGSIQAPDTNINVYSISLGVSNCGEFNGNYSGLGTVQRIDDITALIFQVDNGSYSITNYIYK